LERLPGDGWQAALDLYKSEAEALHAGRTPRPRPKGEVGTLKELCNAFLTAKRRKCGAGELTQRSFDEYRATTDLLINRFGRERLVDDLLPEDFEGLRNEMAKRWGPVRMCNEVQKVRSIFKYGYEARLINQPVRFGGEFKKPSAAVLRRHRAASGERMLQPDEIRRLLDAAPTPVKAMILLGVNCGLGNADLATLEFRHLNLDGGWLTFPRPKTGIARRAKLWTETIEALKRSIAERPMPKSDDDADKVFLTTRGRAWLVRGIANPVSVAVRKLMKSVGLSRRGLGPYTLRHVFATVSSGSRDEVAVGHVMGHVDSSMAGVYREHIDDWRLIAVGAHVRNWLWPETKEPAPPMAQKSEERPRGKSARAKATADRKSRSSQSLVEERPMLRLFAG
jgi:integrase